MKYSFVLAILCSTTIFGTTFGQQTDTLTVVTDTTTTVTTSDMLTTNTTAKKSSGDVYRIKPALDIPITLATCGWSLYGMSQIYGRDKIPESELNALSIYDINRFDRPVADNFDQNAKDASDKLFYGSMPLPLLFLLDSKIRKDGLKVLLLYLEAMGSTGTVYTSGAMTFNRFRPYAYNTSLNIATRQRGGARNSFPAGHPALVATSTFFMAKVFTDYHPNMKGKAVLFGIAAAATATTGYLRVKAGEHFYTDVITGVTLGTLSGLLIPHIHKNKNADERKWSFYPNYQGGSTGVTAVMNIGQ